MWWQTKRRSAAQTSRAQSRYTLVVILVGGGVLVGQMFWVQKNQYRFAPFSIERIQCEECGTTGMVPSEKGPNSPLQMCPVCFGVGSHQVRRIDDRDVLCPACEGMGRVWDGVTSRTCRRCDGRGLIRKDRRPEGEREPAYELQPSTLITNDDAPAPGNGTRIAD